MILEVAPLHIRPGEAESFEASFRQAQAIITATPGYISHELQRCVERANQYVLLVHWQSIDAHEVGFRGSPEYQEWKALLHHYYDPFPTVLHYEVVEGTVDAMSHKQVENTIPVLAVSDLERSIDFYRRILGFEVEWNAGPICSVGRDGSSIMLQSQEVAAPSTVWIGIDDDSIFEGIQSSGAEIVQAPSSKPWAYEMKIADLDGNILWLGAEPRA